MRTHATALLNSKWMRRVTQMEIGSCSRTRKPNIYLDTYSAGNEWHVVRENRGQERLIDLGRIFPQRVNAPERWFVHFRP
jgi:hypothetical protein